MISGVSSKKCASARLAVPLNSPICKCRYIISNPTTYLMLIYSSLIGDDDYKCCGLRRLYIEYSWLYCIYLNSITTIYIYRGRHHYMRRKSHTIFHIHDDGRPSDRVGCGNTLINSHSFNLVSFKFSSPSSWGRHAWRSWPWTTDVI